MTFSIAAADPATGEVGVAVASRFLAVGAVVPSCLVGVGAVATQSYARVSYGVDGLLLLDEGLDPAAAIARLTAEDDDRALRQVGIVAADGRSATFTGEGCHAWAGGVTGPGYAIQGNILVGSEVVGAMEAAWRGSAGAAFAERLLAALAAGDDAGGDSRGRQSAALVVVQHGSGYDGCDVKVDLRVDDDPDPVGRMRRLLDLHDLYFGTTDEATWLPIDAALAAALRTHLVALGLDPGAGGGYDVQLRDALRAWAGPANLEERWWDGDRIDPLVVRELRLAAG